MSFLLYSASLERGTGVGSPEPDMSRGVGSAGAGGDSILLHIKRGRGNRPDEASATCQSGVVPSPAESSFSTRRMSSDGRKEKD
jgi:hypothetical protein